MKRYDPLFNPVNIKPINEVAATSQLVTPPLSPISGEPMQIVMCANNGRKFRVWCHLRDRITLPYKE